MCIVSGINMSVPALLDDTLLVSWREHSTHVSVFSQAYMHACVHAYDVFIHKNRFKRIYS